MRKSKQGEGNVWKGLAAGAVAGLAAAFVMNQFQALWGELMEGIDRSHGAQSLQHGTPDHGVGRELEERGSDDEEDNAAVRAASGVSELIFDHKLSKDEKETGGVVAHYAMGAASGAIYGLAAELLPEATLGAGLPFGAAVWVVADEVIVPALGLSKWATEYPLKTHIYSFVSHLVYGLTTEIVRREVRNGL